MNEKIAEITGRKLKATLRIPCEQFAYIEVEIEETPDNIVRMYRYITRLSKAPTKKVVAEEKTHELATKEYKKDSLNHI